MDAIREGIMKIKPVTRYYLAITLLFSFCLTYGIMPMDRLLLDWHSVFYEL